MKVNNKYFLKSYLFIENDDNMFSVGDNQSIMSYKNMDNLKETENNAIMVGFDKSKINNSM
jgi:hypothetical protein